MSHKVVTQAGSEALLPCVYTFSKDYDFSEPYFPQVNESDSVRKDTTFQPDPPEGWFGFGNSSSFDPPILALDYFQTAPWFYIATSPNITSSELQSLGTRPKVQGLANPLAFSTSTAPMVVNNGTSGQNSSFEFEIEAAFENAIIDAISFATNSSAWTGLLESIETDLFLNISVNRTQYSTFLGPSLNVNPAYLTIANISQMGFNLTELQTVPWFTEIRPVTDDDLDMQISNDILNTLNLLGSLNASAGMDLSYRTGSVLEYPAVAASIQVISNMPWGALRFSTLQNGSYAYMMQVGTDERLSVISSYPPEGLRRMAFQTMFSKAVCIYNPGCHADLY